MLEWINSHGIEVLIAYWIFSAAVSSMPNPKPEATGFYSWVYGFTHTLLQFASGAINRIPQVRQFIQSKDETKAQDDKLISPPDRKEKV